MRKLPLLIVPLLLSCSAPLAAQSPASVPPPALSSLGSTELRVVPSLDSYSWWTGGVLVVVEYRSSGAPEFRIVDPQGKEIFRFTLMLPEASGVRLRGNAIARGSDGAFAVIGHTYFHDSGPLGDSFLALLSPEGVLREVVRLTPYSPQAVTIASDGATWLAGHEAPLDRYPNLEQNLLRRYDRAGKPLGSFLPWSSLPPSPRWRAPDDSSMLAASLDRVGWYVPLARAYIEFHLDGRVAHSLKAAPPRASGEMLRLALCEDNSVFVSSTVNNGRNQKASWGIYSLNRLSGEWSFIPQTKSWGRLYGCYGSRLATSTDFHSITWLAPAPQ
jgi:hypothetical protein